MAKGIVGNVLGNDRAEADQRMLSAAWIETPEYRSLVSTLDHYIVVGRRGTGKSALFLKLLEHWTPDSSELLIRIEPKEQEVDGLKSCALEFGDTYNRIRGFSRIVWRTLVLHEVLDHLKAHYRFTRVRNQHSNLMQLEERWRTVQGATNCERLYYLVRNTIRAHPPQFSLMDFDQVLQTERLQTYTLAALKASRLRARVLFDRLDEGWVPDIPSAAVIGGLLLAATDWASADSPLLPTVFLRDNIYRSIAEHDPDYSRNIQGSHLRLYWDEDSLLHLVCARIRVALGLTADTPDARAWDRVTARKIKGREGFRTCLGYTLFRPRDILSLLNRAFLVAARSARTEIIDDDVLEAAKGISDLRLKDLRDEYAVVFPLLKSLTASFESGKTEYAMSEVLDIILNTIQGEELSPEARQESAILKTPEAIVQGLYEVGFIGLWDEAGHRFQFCHDGASANRSVMEGDHRVLVHPCYWMALNCVSRIALPDVPEIHDEHDAKPEKERAKSIHLQKRRQAIGSHLAYLGKIPKGEKGASLFEDWCLSTLPIVTAEQLTYFQLHPNRDGIQRRDIVATVSAESGFWRRLKEDYDVRQVVFEIKNYDELSPAPEIRQLSSYLHGPYGRAGFIVTRSDEENPSRTELGWIREIYATQSKLCVLLPQKMVCRLLSKCRTEQAFGYCDDQFARILDTYERNYLSLQHSGVRRRRKRRK